MLTFSGATDWPGAARFLRALEGLAEHESVEARTLFDSRLPVVLGRAPGRLDVLGGIADYSGALVLEMPLREAAFVATQATVEPRIRLATLDATSGALRYFEFPKSDFEGGRFSTCEQAHAYFKANREHAWAGYVVGVLLVLLHELRLELPHGLSLLVFSLVPEGKGVSSSAALEVASMNSVLGVLGRSLAPDRIAILCQKAENLVVGAPCGIMDQMTCSLGKSGELLELLCQPAEVLGTLRLPEELCVWGIDSGVRHAVSGADYTQVRVAAFMGQRILSAKLGFEAAPAPEQHRGAGAHLANIAPSEFLSRYAGELPQELSGLAFIERYGTTRDLVTTVLPATSYPVAAATAHPIFENFRARCFRALLSAGAKELESWQLLGELMYQSHASYGTCGLGSPNTDLLVELVRREGVRAGLFGAKITGGGSGGTVAVLGRSGSEGAIARVLSAYTAETGIVSYLFSGSSPGAAEFGARWLERG